MSSFEQDNLKVFKLCTGTKGNGTCGWLGKDKKEKLGNNNRLSCQSVVERTHIYGVILLQLNVNNINQYNIKMKQ